MNRPADTSRDVTLQSLPRSLFEGEPGPAVLAAFEKLLPPGRNPINPFLLRACKGCMAHREAAERGYRGAVCRTSHRRPVSLITPAPHREVSMKVDGGVGPSGTKTTCREPSRTVNHAGCSLVCVCVSRSHHRDCRTATLRRWKVICR